MKRRARFFKRLFVFIVACVVVFCFLGVGAVYWLQRPQSNREITVFIPKRTSVSRVVRLLHEKHAVDFPLLCQLLLYGTGGWRDLKAGEYSIPAAVSPLQLFRILRGGRVILHPITIVEGETSAHVVQKLMADDRFQGACEVPAEGSLFPETYHFPRGTDRQRIILRAQKAMQKVVDAVWAHRSSQVLLRSKEDMVVLASIIEKETALEKEKPLVAAVFLNRLASGMPLQADPTIVYALTQGKHPLGRSLTLEDLLVESPYNTYRYVGLPPAPITNPSLSAMKAAVHPAPIPCLYFVADGSGGHVFCVTLEEHQQNHARWREVRKQGTGARNQEN